MQLLLVPILFFAHVAEAHQPLIVSPATVDETIVVERPEVSWAYYGELSGFPHTYEIRAAEPFLLYTHILEPAIKSATRDHEVIVVRERESGRGVEEMVRLHSKDASWESFYETFGGDSYLSGGEYEMEAPSGTYYIEVSTAQNEGKYVLAIGKQEDFSDVGYFELVRRIYAVKLFFGKPGIAVVQSPFVYVPLSLSILVGFGVYYYRRRRYA